MAKLSKKAKLIKSKVDKTKQYSIIDAVNILKEVRAEKFSEAIDVSVNLGIDPRKSDKMFVVQLCFQMEQVKLFV